MRFGPPAPPNHAALAPDDSTFNRSGANLGIAFDTGMLFPPSKERISNEFKRDALNAAVTLAMGFPTNPSRCRCHPWCNHTFHLLQIPVFDQNLNTS